MGVLDKNRQFYLKWLGVLPFAIILILLFILYPMAQNAINSMLLASIITTVFFLIPGLIVAYLLAKTYIGHGQQFFLWLSVAFFFTSCTGIIKWLPDVNTRTTINSCFFFLASLLCVFSISFIWNKLAGSRRYKYLISVYGSGILLMATIYLLTLEGILPPFFNPQTGNTTIKVALNFASGGLFAIAGIFYLVRTFKSGSSFFYWISLGLLLAALGLVINGFGLSVYTIAAWFSMFVMYLAGLYWLIAAIAVFREARKLRSTISQTIAEFFRQTRENYQRAANNFSGAVNSSTGDSEALLKHPSLWIVVSVIILTIVFYFLGIEAKWDYPNLTLWLNIVFVAVPSLLIAFIATSGFLRSGTWPVLSFGIGSVTFGFAVIFSNWLQVWAPVNAAATDYTLIALTAGAIHFMGAALVFSTITQQSNYSSRKNIVIWAYVALVALVCAITFFSAKESFPAFFIEGTGSTELRRIILGISTFFFIASGLLIYQYYLKSKIAFLHWYALGLILISIPSGANILLIVSGTPFNWTSRFAQLLGGVYLFMAAVTIFREARDRRRPMAEVIAGFGKQAKVNYESLVNAASDAIIAMDRIGRILIWNPAAEKMFGYQQQEIVGLPFFNLLYGVEEAISYQKKSDIFASDKTANTIELKGRRKDGGEFPVELTMAARNVMGWLPTTTTTTTTTLIIRDITERKKAEAELAYRATFPELNPNPIVEIDSEGLIIYLNPSAKLQFPDLAEQGNRHPFLRGWKELFNATANEQPGLPTRDLSIGALWYEQTVSRVPFARTLRIYGNNITERKQAEDSLKWSEANLQRAEAIASLGHFYISLKTGKVRGSKSAKLIYGYDTDETELSDIKKLTLPEYREMLDKAMEDLIYNGKPYNKEFKIRRKSDGSIIDINTVAEFDRENKMVFGIVQDITKRKKIEEEIRQGEERLKQSQGIAHLGSWELDLLNNRLTWSDEVYRIFGIASQDFGATYKAFLESVHPEDREAVDAAYSGSVREGKDSYEIEHRIVRKPSGEVRYVHEKCTHVMDETGKIVRSIGMVHDITESKKAELKIQNQIRIIQATNLVLQEALSARTQEQLGQFCLKVAVEITESKYGIISEITSSGLHDIAIYNPGWDECQTIDKLGHRKLSINDKFYGLFGKVIIDGKSLLTNDPAHHLDRIGIPEGHPPLNSFLGVPLKNQGKTVGIIGVSNREGGYTQAEQEDLEELAPAVIEAIMRQRAEDALVDYKEELEQKVEERTAALQASEEKYRLLVENASEAVLVAQNGYLKLWNRQALEISGRTEEELSTKNFFEFILPEDLEQASKMYQKNISGRDIPLSYELRIKRKDGSIRNLEIRTAKVNWDSKPAILGLAADITDRKKAEEALNMARADLLSANDQLKAYGQRITQAQEEERKRIAYELHDDTAQYLALLKLELDSLIQSDKIKDPKILEKLKFLESDAGRAVNDIRRYSHELRPGVLEHLGLQAALEQIAEDHINLGDIQVELIMEGFEPEMPENIKLGFFRIAQEAINNCRKHAKVSQAYIDLTFSDNRVKMTVSDKGVGFDLIQTSSRIGETGNLGLMSMQERAKLIGADLKVDSKPGQGTTVTLEIHLDI